MASGKINAPSVNLRDAPASDGQIVTFLVKDTEVETMVSSVDGVWTFISVNVDENPDPRLGPEPVHHRQFRCPTGHVRRPQSVLDASRQGGFCGYLLFSGCVEWDKSGLSLCLGFRIKRRSMERYRC